MYSICENDGGTSKNKQKKIKLDGEDADARLKLSLQRWNILREALIRGRSSQLTCRSSASVRRFKSFDLLQTSLQPHQDGDKLSDGDWYLYTCEKFSEFKMTIRHLPGLVKPEALCGFNNTGNVCVWPAEEVLSYYCLKNSQMFSGKQVIELGGGMTCLAGIALGVSVDVGHVKLTDGNEDSVANLEKIIERNSNSFKTSVLSSRMLRWGPVGLDEDLVDKFDFVLCADCLFFDVGREDLVNTVHSLLKSTGEAIMFAPKRGDTFDSFVTMASGRFQVDIEDNYDEEIWTIHCKMKAKGLEQYDPNIHYPLYLRLRKLPESRENSSER